MFRNELPRKHTVKSVAALLLTAVLCASLFVLNADAHTPIGSANFTSVQHHIAVADDTNTQDNHASAGVLEQRGKDLRAEIKQKTDEWKPANSFARLNVTATLTKYIPVGTSFKDAEIVLKAAGVDLAPTPPRPARADDPGYDRFGLMGGFSVYGSLSGDKTCAIRVEPQTPGDPNTTVKSVSAAVYIEGL